jgi:hypothetical protein
MIGLFRHGRGVDCLISIGLVDEGLTTFIGTTALPVFK